jgi:hypothetical protein
MFLQGCPNGKGGHVLLETILRIQSGFQDHVNKFLSPHVQKIEFVHHYTSLAVLLSMLETNELWLTHSSFMNDPQEIEYGVGFVLHLLKRSGRAETVANMISAHRTVIPQTELDLYQELPFIISFTEMEDHVAPWAQYGDGGSGARLQFIQRDLLGKLRSLVPSNKCMYFPVQYFSTDYIGANSNVPNFESIILDFYVKIEEYVVSNNLSGDFQARSALFSVTKLLSSIIKNHFHAQEQEWRFVLLSGPGDDRIAVVPKGKVVRMIFKVGFGSGKAADLLNNIKVGPKHRNDQRIAAAIETAVRRWQGRSWNVSFSEGVFRKEET